ncbi:aspartate ammonia-lyase [Clostridium pasteurianum DSM 525 = ATCC 6013]|uniref:Aspartate ammonia-lyase n=1 Tax=Clostridium pasteurianum DSM 525 = ATCC 6013 TaxID=1262449 RepID=A0A0H3J8H5_CLOPA|nr:aspartate ammonia-lyase [Clostridium pasteurianum]AJA48233.1 aspartate ammonia-lyase [Clostridium pasteurianum DSM 525 = ATCC 6013]AJA52221.1 aspartate ammonia-lyase [Clostridium pasteurianum DSM 525 = ATCC 6013]AOZ75491.1 aspartate ammonia-lyase [Clostridium pasteurianum DSM 525 = ATCC 6013]AOZ79286.1 aspartate ammonia-lyase [Clostridium pasteurianum]ELP60615.1 aspartate ammonia-lyase [Clostridium pasteurianum DSM 525 = ATCC 6013]
MENFRLEKDIIGERKLPLEAYYGINTLRASENFNISNKRVNFNLIKSLVIVKKAAALTNEKIKLLDSKKSQAIIKACDKILNGEFKDQFITDSLQGGAGTSTNMNVNEVISNIAIELLGGKKGDYCLIHPIQHVNMCQSTNDVYPTALRIAAIKLLRTTADSFSKLQTALQTKENEFSHILKLGRTELMDALPIMVGQEFGAYAKAIARDRWRLYKVEERLREINIGGTAIGTGMNAPKRYIFLITDILQDLTGLGLSRSDFPIDITQNMDVFCEVSGLLKAAAVNLMKISNDLRLLGSGPKGGIGEILIPPVQTGSSIMPGKVNPVILEMISQVSMKIIANDVSITFAAANGQLELNAFAPLIAENILESLEILNNAVISLTNNCIKNIKVNVEKCKLNLDSSTALITALEYYIGYDKASEIAKKVIEENIPLRDILIRENILSEDLIEKILNPFALTSPGIPGKPINS